jgi:hypothetical protein
VTAKTTNVTRIAVDHFPAPKPAAAPERIEAHVYSLTPGEAKERMAAGARFFSDAGEELRNVDEIRVAMRRDGKVVQR